MDKELLINLSKQYTSILREEVKDNWLRGDIATYITQVHKEEKAKDSKVEVISDFLKETGESLSGFNQYRWVAESFPEKHLRELPVTWSHYRAAAATDTPKDWLILAHDNGWSCSRLIEEIKKKKEDKEIESGILCWHCSKEVSKEDIVTVSVKRKKKILCSLPCAAAYIGECIVEEAKENSKEVKETGNSVYDFTIRESLVCSFTNEEREVQVV